MDFSLIITIIGLLLTAYSVVANDSVQTLGTWIASNQNIKWYYLWFAASTVFILTITYSWFTLSGDITYGRLDKIPYQTIEWYHLVGPIILVGLTRFGVPVSTTFLTLSVFAGSTVLEQMLIKSFLGYGVAAVAAFIIWWGLSKVLNERSKVKESHRKYWVIGQWMTTGFLWFSWLSHDMANVAVFLPRTLDISWLVTIIIVCVTLFGYIFYEKGGRIQKVVLDKSGTRYIRSATIIDLVYALLLLFFKELNGIPMSTTWVFVGLLCGRELAVHHLYNKDAKIKTIFPIVAKDFMKVMVGLGMSMFVVLLISYIMG